MNNPGYKTEAKTEQRNSRSVEGKFALMNELTVTEWCNVQPGQCLLISCDEVYREQAEEIAQFARTLRGAEVKFRFTSLHADLKRIQSDETIESLREPSSIIQKLCGWVVDNRGAFIRIVGDEDPSLLENADKERLQALLTGNAVSGDILSREIMAGKMNRCVIASATDGWAKDLGKTKEELQDEIFTMCGINALDPGESFAREDEILEVQREYLQGLELSELEFHGPDLNLKVGLSQEAIWLGGKKFTTDERKIKFYANVPIGEIFTTPDYRRTSGAVTTTQPLYINDVLVEGAIFNFINGEVVGRVEALKGEDAINAFLDENPAHRRLGEIALVSLNCASAKVPTIFKNILLDEKKKCHFALGRCYPVCIRNGGDLPPGTQEALGMNMGSSGTQHIDFMFSTPETAVYGKGRGGGKILLVENGVWAYRD